MTPYGWVLRFAQADREAHGYSALNVVEPPLTARHSITTLDGAFAKTLVRASQGTRGRYTPKQARVPSSRS